MVIFVQSMNLLMNRRDCLLEYTLNRGLGNQYLTAMGKISIQTGNRYIGANEGRMKGMLKKAASGVLALLPCSRTQRTLRASKGLRPCWTDFFEHSLAFWCRYLRGRVFASRCELFNSPRIRLKPIAQQLDFLPDELLIVEGARQRGNALAAG